MKKLFENWSTYLNESISTDTMDSLEEVLRVAYDEGLASYDRTQIDASTGEPVDPDAHTEVLSQLTGLVESLLKKFEQGAT